MSTELNHDAVANTAQHKALCHCPVCLTLTPHPARRCALCGARLQLISQQSVQRTVALLCTAVLLFFPANFLPMMTTVLFGVKTRSTILGGVVLLWQHQSYPVAIIIFLASIVIPIAKIIALSWLCFEVQRNHVRSRSTSVKIYRIVEFIGRWSMIDVYVVAILVAMIQMGFLMSVEPGIAALAFAGLVLTTMVAAMTFDPRLLWQAQCDETKGE